MKKIKLLRYCLVDNGKLQLDCVPDEGDNSSIPKGFVRWISEEERKNITIEFPCSFSEHVKNMEKRGLYYG